MSYAKSTSGGRQAPDELGLSYTHRKLRLKRVWQTSSSGGSRLPLFV